MSKTVRCTIDQLPSLIQRDLQKRQQMARAAVSRTAEEAVGDIKPRAPRAFGDLQDSVHSVPGNIPRVVVDAPHAGAVEQGSLPHTPDIDALVAWVKLRGMQGLTSRGNIRTRFARKFGPTTPEQATRIAEMLKAEVVTGSAGKFSPVDAPRIVAEAIARGIQAHGTKPHWFVRDSLPVIAARLDRNVRRAMGK